VTYSFIFVIDAVTGEKMVKSALSFNQHHHRLLDMKQQCTQIAV